MTRSTTRRMTEEARRHQLVELALQLFGRASYDEVSIDVVAEAGGISKGLLYHYFGSKRGLYVAAIRRAADQLIEAIAVPDDLPPEARLRAGFDTYLDYVEQSPEAYVSLLRAGVGVDAEVAAVVEEARGRIAALILSGLGFDEPTVMQQLAVRAWLAASEETCVSWLREPPITRDQLVGFLLSALLAMLAAGAEAESSV